MKRLNRDKIGFSIIGCGAIANIHAKAITSIEKAELRAVADVNIDSARSLAQRYQVERYYGDYRELLKEEADYIKFLKEYLMNLLLWRSLELAL